MELTEQDKPMLMLFIETSILNIQLKRLKMTLERLHHLYAHLVFCLCHFHLHPKMSHYLSLYCFKI